MEIFSKYIDYYSKRYVDTLQSIRQAISSFVKTKHTYSGNSGLYHALEKSKLSRHSNDANLVLFELARLKRRGWPSKYEKENVGLLRTVVFETKLLASWSRKRIPWLGDHGFSGIITEGLLGVVKFISEDLDLAAGAFLNLALAVEAMLGDLLSEDDTLVQQLEGLLLK